MQLLCDCLDLFIPNTHPVITTFCFYRTVPSARIPGLLFYDFWTKQLFGIVLSCLLF